MSVKENLRTSDRLSGAPSGLSHGWGGGARGFSGVPSGVSGEVSAWEDLTD